MKKHGIVPADPRPLPAPPPAVDLDTALEQILEDESVTVAVERLNTTDYPVTPRQLRARDRARALSAMILAKMTTRQIAKELKMHPDSVRRALYRLRSAGLLHDLRDRVEHDLTALAIESAEYHLKKKDKSVTLEHMRGIGLYKNHSHQKHEGGGGFTMPPLQVNVVFGAGAQPLDGHPLDYSEAAVGVARDDAALDEST